MAKKYDGWVIKNKWGSLLFWTFCETREKVRKKVRWRVESQGHKIVKVKLMEVSDG